MNENTKQNKAGYIDGNKHKYASFEKDLLATKSITRLSDNVKIEIDPYDKLIYMVMRDSFYGYKNAGLKYYEDQTDIAAKAGVSASKLKKSIKKWESLELITAKPIRTARGNKSNSYVVTSFSDVSEQYQLDAPQMVEKEPSPGDATQNLNQPPQELLAETTGKHQYQQVKESDRAIASHDDAPLFGDSPSDYQNVPPHYCEEEEGQEDIAPTPEPEKVDQKDFDLAKKTICAAAAFAGIGWDKCFTLLRKNFNLNDATKRALMNDVDAKARVEQVEDKVDEWENVPF
ncbi:hypothetical protein KH388_21510 [Serratia rubidaea]|nr:hypothetical protein [Serratia rubidaea]